MLVCVGDSCWNMPVFQISSFFWSVTFCVLAGVAVSSSRIHTNKHTESLGLNKAACVLLNVQRIIKTHYEECALPAPLCNL